MRVVIVGAGLSGLSAARCLLASDVDVVLVEAASRVGGRVRTVGSPLQEGQHVELGAEWVDTHHHRMTSLLRRHGLSLEGEGQQWTTLRRWLHRHGRLSSPADLGQGVTAELEACEAMVHDAAGQIGDPANPQRSPAAAALDSLSLADVIASAGCGELSRLLRTRESQGEFAAEPGEVSLLFVAQQRAVSAAAGADTVVRAHRIVGGLGALVEAMASEVGDVIQCNERLTSIEHDFSGAVVTTSRRMIVADAVVLACSLVAVQRVHFEPPLPAVLQRAIDQLGYGAVTKTAVQFAAREWPRGYATTDGVTQRIYEPTVDQPGSAGVLMSYAGGDGGRRLAQLDVDERVRLIEAEMRDIHGITATALAGVSAAWSAEPDFGGSYAVYRPGQVTAFWDVLRRPHGRIWLAGEHVATWTGYLEGAVERGESVAGAILDAS